MNLVFYNPLLIRLSFVDPVAFEWKGKTFRCKARVKRIKGVGGGLFISVVVKALSDSNSYSSKSSAEYNKS